MSAAAAQLFRQTRRKCGWNDRESAVKLCIVHGFRAKQAKKMKTRQYFTTSRARERLRPHAHMRVIHHTRNAHTTPAPPHQILIASASAQPPAHMRHTLTRISAHTTRSRPPATPGVHHSHRATRERWPPVALSQLARGVVYCDTTERHDADAAANGGGCRSKISGSSS